MSSGMSAIALLGTVLVPSPPPDSTPDAFLEAARAATARYHDVDAARLDGFRPVGPDFPGMGEHWVNVALLLDGHLDPAAPAILSYAATLTGRRLVGVVYAIPLGLGQRPPDFPVPAEYWHVHSGSIDEESLVLHHLGATKGTGSGHGDGPAAGLRLSVLHAWVWLENPAGTFVTDNWALPYFRAGLEPPPRAPVAAAKMLSFATGADAYYLAAARALAGLDDADARVLADHFRSYGERVADLVRAWTAGSGAATSRDRVEALLEAWARMWCDAADVLSEDAFRRLELLRDPPDGRIH